MARSMTRSTQEQQRHRCGPSSARNAAAARAPKTRKLPAALTSALSRPPAERFMEAMWSDLCTYGGRAAMSALEFYVVDELFVADRGAPGGLDAAAWAAAAADRKVALVHRISSSTLAGRAFCKGVGVGALLSRRMEAVEAEDASPLPSASPLVFVQPAEVASDGEWQERVRATDIRPHRDVRFAGACVAPLVSELSFAHEMAERSSCELLLLWLRRSLRAHLAEDDVGALLDGAHVILEAAREGSESFEQAVRDVATILEDCAPECARELPLRWDALQIVDTGLDRVAVALLPTEALPAFYCAATRVAPVEAFAVADECTLCTSLDGDSPRSPASVCVDVGRLHSVGDVPPTASDSGRMEHHRASDDEDGNDGKPCRPSASTAGILAPFQIAETNVEQEMAERSLGNLSLMLLKRGLGQESQAGSEISEEALHDIAAILEDCDAS